MDKKDLFNATHYGLLNDFNELQSEVHENFRPYYVQDEIDQNLREVAEGKTAS